MAPTVERKRVFIDTSVLFAAVLSATGGSRLILKLGEAGVLRLVVSRQVLREADGVLRQKAPDAVALFGLLLDQAGVQIGRPAPRAQVEELRERVGHPGDARIVADAMRAKVDYLVTLDKKHLLGNTALSRHLSFPVGTSGDLLALLRHQLGTLGHGSGDVQLR